MGEGRFDALWGILGMVAGAALYAEAYPYMEQTLLTWGNLGKITVPEVIGINHWIVITVFLLGVLLFFQWSEKKGL